ncbi:MAG TPA: hypothetical protein VKU01_04620 [Bryobacteraceae bacterium]|nr:hypothetical protein [Bryobacteraceae bacterium]
MAEGFGGFVKNLFDKGAAHLSVQMRKSNAEKAHKELSRLAYQKYSHLYLGQYLRSSIHEVVQGLEDFISYNLHGWRQIASHMTPDGKSAHFRYVMEFTETFHLGVWGCPLRPLTAAAGMKVSWLQNNNKQEAVSVPYRLILTIDLKQSSAGVMVSSSVQELIDPTNSVVLLRNGHFAAPPLLTLRAPGVSVESLLKYLHEKCPEDRPRFQEWFDGEGHKMPELAAAVKKLNAAQDELDRARTRVQQVSR